MKALTIALIASLTVIAGGAVTAHADTFTQFGIWDTYRPGK